MRGIAGIRRKTEKETFADAELVNEEPAVEIDNGAIPF